MSYGFPHPPPPHQVGSLELQVKVVSTGTTGLAIQLKCSNRLCLWTQPSVNSTIRKTEKLTTEGELHHQDAPCLVPEEEALPLVTGLKTPTSGGVGGSSGGEWARGGGA